MVVDGIRETNRWDGSTGTVSRVGSQLPMPSGPFAAGGGACGGDLGDFVCCWLRHIALLSGLRRRFLHCGKPSCLRLAL
jgi:hypothetical protein